MPKPVHVTKRPGGATRIQVADWPSPHEEWCVRTVDPPRGRNLEVVGPSKFKRRVCAHMRLHVQKGRGPLMIADYRFESYVHTSDRPLALVQLVLCARAIARRLHADIDVGNGGLLWELEERRFDEIINAGVNRRIPQFEPVPKHRRPQPRRRYLLWRAES
jgi:hypothetical protein